jgi:hypothetical protein
MTQVYKLVSNKDKIERVRLFNHVQAGRTRMAADPLNIRSEHARSDVRRNFFSQRIISEWNKIPSAIKTSSSVKVFKERYRRFANNIGTDGEP